INLNSPAELAAYEARLLNSAIDPQQGAAL
ncbi:MAG: hypothetical protein RLZZ616_876, partial [Pseudomonadota bacterium]